MIIILSIAVIVFVAIRLIIVKKAQAASVDEYYWLQYRDASRRQKRFLPQLPQYLLELRQWYPPLYGKFLQLLPESVFEHRNIINYIFNVLRLGNYFIFAYFLGIQITTPLLLLIIVIYLASPSLFTYDNQLNSRILGSIFFDLSCMFAYTSYFYDGLSILPSIGMIVCYLVMLFLHKTTLQLQLVIAVAWGACLQDFTPLMLFFFSFGVSFLFGYKSIFKHHCDISKFWWKNRDYLGAHQINNSPLYNAGQTATLSVRECIKQSTLIIGMCPFVVLVFSSETASFWEIAIGATLVLSLLTNFVPHFKSWGPGRNYSYFQSSLIILFLIVSSQEYSSLFYLVLFLCLGVCLLSAQKYKQWLTSKAQRKDLSFDKMIDYLRRSKRDRILSIPTPLGDELAFKTGKTVLWGGHGYGFKILQPYFPVLRVKPEEAAKDWNLGAVVVDKSYWPNYQEHFPDSFFEVVFQEGHYVVFAIKNWENKAKTPPWVQQMYPGCTPL